MALVMLNCGILASREMENQAAELGTKNMSRWEKLLCHVYLSLTYFFMVPMPNKEVVQNLHPRGDAQGLICYKRQNRREFMSTNSTESGARCDAAWGLHQILVSVLLKNFAGVSSHVHIMICTGQFAPSFKEVFNVM